MTSAYQVHVTTLDRNVSVPHTDAGLRDLAVGDPLVYVGHQGDVMSYLACEAHGRLVQRSTGWVCVGFDGEGTGWCTAGPVPPDAAGRLLAGVTYWPGVLVLDEAGQVTGKQRAASRARDLVNAILRAGSARS